MEPQNAEKSKNAGKCPFTSQNAPPVYDVDFYTDDVIANPWEDYAAMRELGPVVWLPRLGNFAITRYAEVREALRNWRVFSSAQGIAADQFGCDFIKGGTLTSDPPRHEEMRAILSAPLLPRELEKVRGRIEEVANELIERLATTGSFDGVSDFARVLPLAVVADLVGLPEEGRENMLLWAAAAFEVTGVQNERGRHGLETSKEMRDWIQTKGTPDRLKPGSWTARLYELDSSGAMPKDYAPNMMREYISPSLDTTISATAEMIYQIGRNPDQWEKLRADPSLVPNAVNEAVRLASPIRSFTRTLTEAYTFSGVTLLAGARAMMLFASANRDERKFENPNAFDVTRHEEHLLESAGE